MFSSEFMGSDFYPSQTPEQAQPSSCGLSRYKSAPSSFLAALLDSNNNGDNNSSSGDESEAFFSALMSAGDQKSGDGNRAPQYNRVKQEGGSGGQMGYESAVSGGGGCIVGSYSVGMESNMRMMGGSGSSLVRQSSSPAGLFNGFGEMGEAVGNYRVHNQAKPNGMTSNHHISFSSTPSSTTGFMPTIPEDSNQGVVAMRNPENGQLRTVTSSPNGREFDAWINESPFNSGGLKRSRDGELRMFSDINGLDNRNGETRKNLASLVHHYSLPKTSAEMAEVEKFLQFQPESTVACQVRAKRGCATHPRSIAERMRRTRISEKMKKLQDLFPNMDKQTSTADMLDLAVEYIKDLQRQVETLTDTKEKCICSSKPQQS